MLKNFPTLIKYMIYTYKRLSELQVIETNRSTMRHIIIKVLKAKEKNTESSKREATYHVLVILNYISSKFLNRNRG